MIVCVARDLEHGFIRPLQTITWYRIVEILRESLFVLPMQSGALRNKQYFRRGSSRNTSRTRTDTVIDIGRVSEFGLDGLCLYCYLLSIGVIIRCLDQSFLIIFC